jgi:hypothetical protein
MATTVPRGDAAGADGDGGSPGDCEEEGAGDCEEEGAGDCEEEGAGERPTTVCRTCPVQAYHQL